MKKEDRPCPVCGDQVIGRRDKKFCSDQCRSTYNNDRYSNHNSLVEKVNRCLKKNYSILQGLNHTDKRKVRRTKLLQEGFDFSHFTSMYETKQGHVYYLVYDQGYLPLENDMYLLIKWEV